MEENKEREAQGEGYEANPEILISEPTLNPPSTCSQTPPEPFEDSNPALGQTEILRALEVVERDSVAIAENFTSLFSSLRLAISEVTGSSVNHMHCFTDAAGCLQESVLNAATKGNRYMNSCLRLNEEMKGMDSPALQLYWRESNGGGTLQPLQSNTKDVLDTAVHKLLRLP